ncbi:MAG: hypothetical protein EBT37_10600 [Betaproteobacteria bacterium]|nr:hypothetical protein [Betaproteobacteria bacterium]
MACATKAAAGAALLPSGASMRLISSLACTAPSWSERVRLASLARLSKLLFKAATKVARSGLALALRACTRSLA